MTINKSPLSLVLASSSPYRRQLLERLGLEFAAVSPEIDESPLKQETPHALVARLAKQKAEALTGNYPEHLIIGSDQVATCEGLVLGKPHNEENACTQLRSFSGKTVTFLTSLCVLNSCTGEADVIVEPFKVVFRDLTDQEISNYVKKEQPLNCAGSFKSENLGIALFERMEGDDPNSLIGLPLIQLLRLLRRWNVNPLSDSRQGV